MYKSFFGLRVSPFGVTANPEFLAVNQNVLQVLGCMLYGIQENRGFIQLTGEIGTGKTVLLKTLLRKLNRDLNYRVAFLFNSRLNRASAAGCGVPGARIVFG
jgi:general secretion pathway protein A